MAHTMSDSVREKLRACSVPSVVSTLFRMGFQNVFLRGVKPLALSAPVMVGPAMTMRTIPIREDMRKAIADGEFENLQGRAFNETAAGEVARAR